MRKAHLFIQWAWASACWVESRMTSLMNLRRRHGKRPVTLTGV